MSRPGFLSWRHVNLVTPIPMPIWMCTQEQAEAERQAHAKEQRRRQAQAEEKCASLEAQLAARKGQVAELRADLQVCALSCVL